MSIQPLHPTVILIDKVFLNDSIVKTVEFYKELYPQKHFEEIEIQNLLYQFLRWARVEEEGQVIDVIFAYTWSDSVLAFCKSCDVFDFIDVHRVSFPTDKGILRVRSFSADEEEGETSILKLIDMLYGTFYSKIVSTVILVAEDAELNPILKRIYAEQTDGEKEKSLIMIKNRTSDIEVPAIWVNIVYPIAEALGLERSEW